MLKRFFNKFFKKKEPLYYIILTKEQASNINFLIRSQNTKYWIYTAKFNIVYENNKLIGTKPNLLKMIKFLRVYMWIASFQVYIELFEVKR